MGLVVNHNMMAMAASRNLSTIYGKLAVSTARLSSGLRINSAADDAAGLAVRESMRADIAVLNQGVRNAGDAISLIQTAEGALSVVDEKLIRMKELAEQAATGSYTDTQRTIMDSEYQAMANEIDRIANATDFNSVKLLDGSLSSSTGLKIHFGTGNDSDEDYYYISIAKTTATDADGLAVGGGTGRAEILYNDYSALTYASAGEVVQASGGYFTFQYDADASASNAVTEYFAFMNVASGATLTELANQINYGTAAQASLSINGGVSGAQTVTIGDITYEFASLAGDATSGNIELTMGSITITASEAVDMLTVAVNNNGVAWAIEEDSDTLIFYARENGVGGNTIATTQTLVSAAFGASLMSGGGNEWVTASVEQNTSRYGDSYYHLVLTGETAGADYDLTIGNANTALSGVTVNNLSNYSSSDFSEYQDATGASGTAGASIDNQERAQAALEVLDTAIASKDNTRASLGSLQNRLENTITNLTVQAENLQAAESRVSDVDVALEMTEFTKNNILVQAAVAMLAQANTLPTLALTLLGG